MNVVKRKKAVAEEADSVSGLEGSIYSSVIGEGITLLRGRRE